MDNNNNTMSQYDGFRKWDVKESTMAQNTFNPIRAIVDGMKTELNPEKKKIALSLGDPTVFGNLPPPKEAIDAIKNAASSGLFNGYSPSSGHLEAREAVAKYVSTAHNQVKAENVFLASGCSNALEIAMSVLVNPGENILIPRPGFSLYQTLGISQGMDILRYDCLPDKSWEIDLDHLESLINEKTSAIMIVNPSNPCGSNFSEKHIHDILEVAEKHRIPIIADEIYADIVFPGQTFTSCASLSSNVPILTCGGIGKRFLVPGWRLGWVVMNDKNGILGDNMQDALLRLTQRILGPCTLVQAALKSILEDVPESFHQNTINILECSARLCYDRLKKIKGLKPVKPQAAFYLMVGIEMEHFPTFKNDVDFTSSMISEQSVVCLPAECFSYPNFFRIVITVPEEQMIEALERMDEFCQKHYMP